MIAGPRLREELFNILVRFRLHKIAFSAEIEEMYLHIRLNNKDQDCLRIIRRKNPDELLEDYQPTAAAFGLKRSPFLAVATLQYHAKGDLPMFPGAGNVIIEDSCMDIINSRCNVDEIAFQLQKEASKILADAGFLLRKWYSESTELMKATPAADKERIAVVSRDGHHKFATTTGNP